MFPDATRPVIELMELQALCRPASLGRLIAVGRCWLSLLWAQGGQGGLYRPGGLSLDEGGCDFTGALGVNVLWTLTSERNLP